MLSDRCKYSCWNYKITAMIARNPDLLTFKEVVGVDRGAVEPAGGGAGGKNH
jgi:hypothetical protein